MHPISDDLLCAAAVSAAEATLDEIVEWHGSLSLLLRDFLRDRSAVVSGARSLERARELLGALAPGDAEVLARAMAAASPEGDPVVAMSFAPTTFERACADMERHIAHTQRGAVHVRRLLELFSAPRFGWWDLGDLRRSSLGTTSLFVASSTCAALIEYVGDGP